MKPVCLVHFGSPRSEDELQGFLTDIFADHLPLPFLAGLFARLIRRSSLKKHREMGFDAVSKFDALAQRMGGDVFVAAQYGKPTIRDTVEKIYEAGFEHITVVPLYPHASLEMYDRIVEKFANLKKAGYRNLSFAWTPPFYDDPNFVKAWADSINGTLKNFDDKSAVHIVISAHAHPSDDPVYRKQVEITADGIKGLIKNPSSIAFQSAMGGGKWSRPSLAEELKALAGKGVSNVVIAPVSFLFDNVETLFDIEREAIPLGKGLGIRNVTMAPPPGDSQEIVEMLRSMVL